MTKDVFKIKKLEIEGFRGIKNLTFNDCSDINLILGNNNCGKTSVLEAIELLKNQKFSNLIEIAKDRRNGSLGTTINEMHFLFPEDTGEISISADTATGSINIKVKEEVTATIFSKEMFLRSGNSFNNFYSSLIDSNNLDGAEAKQIKLKMDYNGQKSETSFVNLDLLITGVDKIDDLLNDKSKTKDNVIVYQSPFSHFSANSDFSAYISAALKLLPKSLDIFNTIVKTFDPKADSIMLLQSESILPLPEVYIVSKNKTPKPLTVYGDGLKKALVLSKPLMVFY